MEQKILTTDQLRVLGIISKNKFITKTFFFTGGTALSAFYFKHRFSEDLDFFSEKKFSSKNLIIAMKEIAQEAKVTKIESQKLTGQIVYYFYFGKKPLKIDFSYFPFPHIGKFAKLNDLKITSIEDVAINKIHAIQTRKRARDYFDLYLCTQGLGWKFNDFIKKYKLKFDVNLDKSQLITSFINVMDATDLPKFKGKSGQWKKTVKYFLTLGKTSKKVLFDKT